MSVPDANASEQCTDHIASSVDTLSTPSTHQMTTCASDVLVSPEVVTTSSSSTTATTIDGEMNVDQATVALSFSNDNTGDEVVDHAFSLQFDTLTGSGQHNELFESSPFTSDVGPSPETQVENNQTTQEQPQEDRLFQDNISPRNNKNIDAMDATTITMSSPTIQAVQPPPPITQVVPALPLKPKQTNKPKKTQLPHHQIQFQSQHPIAPEQSPQTLPTPQRKSPRRHIPTKGTGVVKKGTKRRHASSTTPSPTTESVTTGGTTTLSNQVFSWNDILRVQNLIERCLQLCLSKDEIVATLQAQASVDPSFTAVIWQKLEEQNPSFFKAYTIQLQLKDQVVAFNYLMTQQKDMMAKSLSIDSRSSGFARHGAGGGTSARNLGPSRLGSAGHNAQQKLQQQRQQSQHHSNEDNTRSNSLSVPSSGFHQTSFNSSHQSSLPLPSPIKTDLDTHAFFT